MAISLFEHNETAYYAALSMMKKTGKAAIVHPTGTGKSFIGFKLCEDNPNKKICWLSPSEYIFKTQLENLSAVSDETMQEMREQVALRKKIEDVVNFGDMYRLDSPFEKDYSSIEFLSEDKSRVVLFHCCVLGHRNGPHYFVKLQDLEPDATYVCEETGVEYSGSVLCNHGVMFMHRQDFESHLYNFRKK